MRRRESGDWVGMEERGGGGGETEAEVELGKRKKKGETCASLNRVNEICFN